MLAVLLGAFLPCIGIRTPPGFPIVMAFSPALLIGNFRPCDRIRTAPPFLLFE